MEVGIARLLHLRSMDGLGRIDVGVHEVEEVDPEPLDPR